jgi:hypothetical protein
MDIEICGGGAMRAVGRWCLLYLGLGVFAVLGSGVVSAAPALATEGGPPNIERLSVTIASEAGIHAYIDPNGLETTYAIEVECKTEAPLWSCESLANAPHGEGVLAAGLEGEEVSLDVTSLQPGSYRFAVLATNAAGGELRHSTLEIPKGVPIPENTATQFTSTAPSNINELDERAAEQSTAEYWAAQKVKEEQEKAAREAAQRAAEPAPAVPQCVVPSLTGHTLAGARRLLARAHCRLGHVSYSRRRHGSLHIAKQNPARGMHLAAEAGVSVRLVR